MYRLNAYIPLCGGGGKIPTIYNFFISNQFSYRQFTYALICNLSLTKKFILRAEFRK